MISKHAIVFLVKRGYTWSAEHGEYRSHKSLGATVTKAPVGWRKFFDPPSPSTRRLKVVSIVYDWSVYN